jgi:hypothetical protein
MFELYSRVTRMSQIYMWDSTILLIIVVGYPLSDNEVARPKIGILDTVSIDGYHFEINHSLRYRTSLF